MTPYEQWVALLTLMRKEIRRYTRIWSQTLFAVGYHHVIVLPHLWQPHRVTNRGDGRRQLHGVCGARADHDGNCDQLYANVVSSFFGSKFNNSIEELLVSPTPNHIILLGFVWR